MPRAGFLVMLAALAAFVGAFVGGCSGCRSCLSRKTDAELAAEERAKADELWRGSLALTPWRALKGAERSKGAPNRPDIYKKVDAALAELARPAGPDAEADAKRRADTTFDLLTYLVLHRGDLAKYDEDLFPRLANVWLGAAPPAPAPWYDNEAEHLLVALGVLAIDAADKSERVPARDIVFYELSRAAPQEAWPAPLRMLGRYARGVSYLQHALHYAADEELTGYIGEVEKADATLFVGILPKETSLATKPGVTSEQATREILLAVGYFTRAFNRMKLEREEAATEDIEKGLACLDRIGVENELTLWAWAVVHQRRGRYDESARALEKLADSPYLDDTAKADIRAAAADVRKHSKDGGWFHRERTSLAVVRAVVARLGGAENVLAFFIGEEDAHKVFAPFAAISSLRETLRTAAAKEGTRFEGLAEGAAESGKKAFEDLKGKVFDAAAK